MAGLMDTIMQSLGGNAQQQLGQRLGLDPAQLQSALGAAVPTILAGLASNAAQPGGAQSLLAALDRNHDGSVLDDVSGFFGGGDASAAAGTGILGHVFGDRHQTVNDGLARHTGLSAAQLATITAMAAPIVMGVIGRMKHQQGLDQNGLAQMLGQEHQATTQQAPDIAGLATSLLGAGQSGGGLGGLLGSLLGGKQN